MATHYDVLGVSPTASPDEIRSAYHSQARAWHPDRFVGKPEVDAKQAEGAMRRVNEAFRVVGNSERRAYYDGELAGSYTGTGRVSVDDGVTRIDPRLLDPERLAAKRRREDATRDSQHSRAVTVIPWVSFLSLLAAIFIFTAYANQDDPADPLVLPGPDLGVEANACVRVMQGPSLIEVSCNGVTDGRVIGARLSDGTCPSPFTVREIALAPDLIACLANP